MGHCLSSPPSTASMRVSNRCSLELEESEAERETVVTFSIVPHQRSVAQRHPVLERAHTRLRYMLRYRYAVYKFKEEPISVKGREIIKVIISRRQRTVVPSRCTANIQEFAGPSARSVPKTFLNTLARDPRLKPRSRVG